MKSLRIGLRNRRRVRLFGTSAITLLAIQLCPIQSLQSLGAQETPRSSYSQRGVYTPPTLTNDRGSAEPRDAVEVRQPRSAKKLVVPRPPAELETENGTQEIDIETPAVVQVAHRTILVPQDAQDAAGESPDAGGAGDSQSVAPRVVKPKPPVPEPVPAGDVVYESVPAPYQDFGTVSSHCDSGAGCCDSGCDSLGCDSLGSYLNGPTCGIESCSGCDGCAGGRACIPFPSLFDRQWFGSAEWLMWYREGQSFPTLAQTAAGASLFGGNIGEEGESGGRFTVGRWLDRRQTQSFDVRFWGVGEETHSFNATPANNPSVVRPFNGAGSPLVIINNTTAPTEFLRIGFDSEIYGADVSLKQLWVRGLGGRVDFIYGYQYFRLAESLGIQTRAVTDFPASSQEISELFAATNNFHGGHFGLQTNYREGRWIFDGRFKLGLGSINREGLIQGVTVNQIGANPPATLTEGLLATNSNIGTESNSTFAFAPEVNLTLGYRLNRNMDFTVGYTYFGMTDALQAWQMIDTTVDAANGRPARNFRYNDYWVQGLSLGVAFNY